MEPIVSTIEIDRPPDEVFAVATDPTRFPDWQKDVVSVEMEGKGVGAQFTTTRRIGPAKQMIVQEITQADPPRHWAARGIGGYILANGTITIDPLDEGRRSRVTISLDFDARGPARAFLPMVVAMTRSAAPKSYRHLKELLERESAV
jgi:carbon monoxide dehydrogenase subunit G